jgi:hypothetical protein
MKIRNMLVPFALLAFSALPLTAEDSGGIIAQSIDALFNLRDQLQGVVMKSVKGVGEAMQEGPAAEAPGESSIAYWTRMQAKYQGLYNINKNLLDNQRNLQNVDLQLLVKLPTSDPRRQLIADEIKNVGNQMTGTQQSLENFRQSLGSFNQAIADYYRRNPPPGGPVAEGDAGHTTSSHSPEGYSGHEALGSGHGDPGHSQGGHSQPGHSGTGHGGSGHPGSGHSQGGHSAPGGHTPGGHP